MVAPNEGAARRTIGRSLEKMAELNADQQYFYSDEELIEMLKEAMAAQRVATIAEPKNAVLLHQGAWKRFFRSL